MTERPRILIVEDDARMAGLVREHLALHELDGVVEGHGGAALDRLRREAFDLVVLDLMLPGLDGLELTRRIRADGQLAHLPILMVTARGDDVDRIVGLELGADDYLPKPFNPRELVARIRALLRRTARAVTAGQDRVTVGELVIDLGARTVHLEDRAIALTWFEFELLACLAREPGRVMSRERLFQVLKGEAFETFDRSIDVHVSNLRQKLGDNPQRPRYIRTVRNVGYVLLAEPDSTR